MTTIYEYMSMDGDTIHVDTEGYMKDNITRFVDDFETEIVKALEDKGYSVTIV